MYHKMMNPITWLTFQNIVYTRLNINANFYYNFYFNFRHYDVTKLTKKCNFHQCFGFFLACA